MRATPQRCLAGTVLAFALGACGSADSSPATTTTDVVPAAEVEGADGSDSWTLRLTPQDDGFCLTLDIDPPMRSPIVVGRSAAMLAGQSKIAGADSCLGQPLDADPQAVTFEPVFAPFIYSTPEFRRRVIAGAVSDDVGSLELELSTGERRPVTVREGGLFIDFPPEEVVAVRMTLDDEPWRCGTGSIDGVGPCTPLG